MAIVLKLAYRMDRIDEVEKANTDADQVVFQRKNSPMGGFNVYSTVLEYVDQVI